MKYELILFDADGVLFDFDKAETYALEKVFAKYGIPFLKDESVEHYRKVNKQFWRMLENGLITVNEIRIERFRKFLDELNAELDAEEFGKNYLSFLSEADFLLGDPEPVLEKLAGRTKMLIATNGLTEVQNNRFKKSGLLEYFDGVVISEEAGAPKPDPVFFRHAFLKADHKNKDTAIIIGDNWPSDIRGGVDFGIDTCFFNPRGISVPCMYSPTFDITEIREFLDIVE